MTDEAFFAAKLKKLLDRFQEVAGREMMGQPGDPPPLPDHWRPDVSMSKRPERSDDQKLTIGPRTMEVLAYIRRRRKLKQPFPSLYDITKHMDWPQDGAHRQAKDAIKRLVAGKKVFRENIPWWGTIKKSEDAE